MKKQSNPPPPKNAARPKPPPGPPRAIPPAPPRPTPCHCGCGKTVKPTKRGRRFYDAACRARYSRAHKAPGKIAGVRQLANGTWSIIVRYPNQPKGLQVGSQVRVEKADQ